MPRQARLDLRRDHLEELWRRFPKRVQRAVIEQYARLIARAAQAPLDRRAARKP
jgi:hypothetical protein